MPQQQTHVSGEYYIKSSEGRPIALALSLTFCDFILFYFILSNDTLKVAIRKSVNNSRVKEY